LRKQASKQASKPDVRRDGHVFIDGPGSHPPMKLSDEAVALVDLRGSDEANAVRRKAFLESGKAYAGLTSGRYLVTSNKSRAGGLPRRRYALWRHSQVFIGASPVLRKSLLQGEQRASPHSPSSHLLTPDRCHYAGYQRRHPHPA